MDKILGTLIIMEMLFVNLFVVDACAHERYTKKATVGGLLAFTILLNFLTADFWYSLGFANGNGLFAVFGIAFLFPLRLLYQEKMLQITGILFTSWIYTMLVYSLSVCLTHVLPVGDFLESILLIQTVLYCVSFYFFIHWIKNAFLFVLHNTTPKIKHYLPHISLSWFFTIIIINLAFLYQEFYFLHIASMVAIAINIIMSYLLIYSLVKSMQDIKSLEEIVYIDPLTGLLNRAKLFIDGEHFIQKRRPFSLIYFDLDHFKSINDQYGHLAGDQYLQFFAEHTTKLLGKSGTLYRMSGDEFVCLYTGREKERILDKLRNYPTAIPGKQIAFLGYSIGLADYPGDSDSLDKLIRIADHMMYEHKHSTR